MIDGRPARVALTLTLTLTLGAAACGPSKGAAGPAPAPPATVAAAVAPTPTYYIGHSDVVGMDGTIYVHDAPALVERTVDPTAGVITETVWVGSAHAMVTSTLRQTADPQVFDATDASASFTGTLTYDGDPWQPRGWTYAITLTDGGTITGAAQIRSDEIWTEKLFTGPGGHPQAQIKEVVRRATPEAFAARRRELTGE